MLILMLMLIFLLVFIFNLVDLVVVVCFWFWCQCCIGVDVVVSVDIDVEVVLHVDVFDIVDVIVGVVALVDFLAVGCSCHFFGPKLSRRAEIDDLAQSRQIRNGTTRTWRIIAFFSCNMFKHTKSPKKPVQHNAIHDNASSRGGVA